MERFHHREQIKVEKLYIYYGKTYNKDRKKRNKIIDVIKNIETNVIK